MEMNHESASGVETPAGQNVQPYQLVASVECRVQPLFGRFRRSTRFNSPSTPTEEENTLAFDHPVRFARTPPPGFGSGAFSWR